MSPQEEALWQAVAEKNYGKVENLIKEYPELVNAVNTNGRTLLIRLVLAVVPPLELIKFIAKQPNLSFENPSPEATQTTMGAILSTGRPEILEIFANDPRIVFDGDKLTYVTAKKNMDNAKQAKLENYTRMFHIIRDASIRYAIAQDDPTILEKLEKAGDNLAQKLSDGKLPVRLITRESPAPRAKIWFQSQIGKSGVSIAAHSESFFNHAQEMQKAEAQMDELDEDKIQKEEGLLNRTYNSALETMGRVASYFSLSS
ncbi:hypothetical protein OQJ18_08500 [Fluoribacter dumoffii]|uniref:Uncharacterized protein n=1 Tax=Fluoribacter dumoffii TaxID=463 RepID=A0A377G7W4_9GAMM|nr:hypothetical protein [Fluoribacter dumoffii]KTC89608.1 hypothetical protein Ldum_0676 [Fluoribacter dumoffii NY 23]MCW8384801.1 hypothetical protein [Fluoribacter dumoffii]MCW8454294.1 hypothetical protein [Fluoribacter dumoffii]MCW8461632.1 hypothetical protein [Fluoribacter dumoffii]MCW8481848.1 hypothetical protein [Fluoribacter dumoffii]